MSDTISKIPKSLRVALEAGNVVPFVGAGVSMSVKKKNDDGTESNESLFPSWKGFVEILVQALNDENRVKEANSVRKLIESPKPEYLKAIQDAFDQLPESVFYETLDKSFRKNEMEAAENSLELPRLIWHLGSNVIFTTNIDRVLEWNSVKDGSIEILDTQKIEAAQLLREKNPPPTIIYLHGRIGDKENIVFTREQYDNFYKNQKNEAKLQTLKLFLTTKAFLFIGFSLDDAFFVEELEHIHEIFKGGTMQFYALIKKSDAGKLKHLKFVSEVYFEDFGEPLIKAVRGMCDIARVGTPPPEPPKNSNKSFFNVPFASKGQEFVGRVGKIDEIWNLLNEDGCASIGQAVSVKGFGGLGKTQLAVEYAHAFRDRYKNGVFWMVADQPIDTQLLQIGDEMGWTAQADEQTNQLEAAKNGFLALSDCLILFDNVEAFDGIKDFLPKASARTHILITSREKIYEFGQINLELLDRSESRELLLKIAEREPTGENEKEHLEQILEILGDIPLAVELVGGYLAEHETVTFEKYHQFLDEYPLATLEKEFPKSSFTGHDRSIIQTLRISEKTINEKPLMVEILKVLAWSGSSSMGKSLLQTLVEPESEFEFETAVGDAHKLRLLKKDEDTEGYAIHRLLAKVIQYENPLEKQKKWHERIAGKLIAWFSARLHKFEYLTEFESEIEHLEVWQENLIDILPEQAVRLLSYRGNIPYQRGIYQTAFNYYEEALNLYNREKLSDKSFFAFLQNELGSCLDELGNHEEALKYNLQSLEIGRELFGEKHPETATSLDNVGYTYGYLSNHEEALKYKLQSLEIRRELFGENHLDTAISLNNVGYTYGYLGNHEEALKYLLQSLEIRRELFGEKHPYTATSLNNIGLTYGDLGNHEEALKYLLQSLEIHQELLGKQHPNTIVIAGNLINTYLVLGEKEKAGRKAAEYFSYISPDHPYWKWFEELSRPYRQE